MPGCTVSGTPCRYGVVSAACLRLSPPRLPEAGRCCRQNWEDETLDGVEFELPEPEPGEFWGRDESFGEGSYYQLPASGILKVRYMTTPMVPRFDDCIDEEMVDKLIELMSDKFINDHGTMLVQLASFDFYFTAKIAATLAILTTDTINKVIAMSALLPRVIDPVNLTADCYDWMSDTEMATLVRATPRLRLPPCPF